MEIGEEEKEEDIKPIKLKKKLSSEFKGKRFENFTDAELLALYSQAIFPTEILPG